MAAEKCDFGDVGCYLEWLQEELKALALWLWIQVLDGLAALLEWLPVPEFLTQVDGLTLPPGVLYWLGLFQVQYGLGLVVGAYVLRFILRRIPLIG